MNEPGNWTPAELAHDATEARETFRRQRLDEPLELYSRFFEAFAPLFGETSDRLPSLAGDPFDPEGIAEIMGDRDARTAFRYLAAPPVSEDDLKTLAEKTLSAKALRGDAEQARRVRDTVLQIVDPHRFPWIGERRNPTDRERIRAGFPAAYDAAPLRRSSRLRPFNLP